MDCNWNANDDGSVVCKTCGFRYSKPVRRMCRPDGQPPQRPQPETDEQRKEREEQKAEIKVEAEKIGITAEHIGHYAKALWRWIKAGRPVRSDEEVAAIYAEHCAPCDELVDGRCRRCGCGVAPGGMAAMNKIKLLTENCLDKKW